MTFQGEMPWLLRGNEISQLSRAMRRPQYKFPGIPVTAFRDEAVSDGESLQ